jgi:hypothetical protein
MLRQKCQQAAKSTDQNGIDTVLLVRFFRCAEHGDAKGSEVCCCKGNDTEPDSFVWLLERELLLEWVVGGHQQQEPRSADGHDRPISHEFVPSRNGQ